MNNYEIFKKRKDMLLKINNLFSGEFVSKVANYPGYITPFFKANINDFAKCAYDQNQLLEAKGIYIDYLQYLKSENDDVDEKDMRPLELIIKALCVYNRHGLWTIKSINVMRELKDSFIEINKKCVDLNKDIFLIDIKDYIHACFYNYTYNVVLPSKSDLNLPISKPYMILYMYFLVERTIDTINSDEYSDFISTRYLNDYNNFVEKVEESINNYMSNHISSSNIENNISVGDIAIVNKNKSSCIDEHNHIGKVLYVEGDKMVLQTDGRYIDSSITYVNVENYHKHIKKRCDNK